MTTATIDAVFEDGTFRMVHPSDLVLRDGQRVRLVVETQETPDVILELAAQVYAGFSPQEREEIEQHSLERRPFFEER